VLSQQAHDPAAQFLDTPAFAGLKATGCGTVLRHIFKQFGRGQILGANAFGAVGLT
jgi:hypothetical protein